jgi:hypothetical protein
VVVTATVDGHKGDGMKVDMHVSRFLSGLRRWVLIKCRSRTQLETSMGNPRTLWASKEWHSLLTQMHRLMSALKTISQDVYQLLSPICDGRY